MPATKCKCRCVAFAAIGAETAAGAEDHKHSRRTKDDVPAELEDFAGVQVTVRLLRYQPLLAPLIKSFGVRQNAIPAHQKLRAAHRSSTAKETKRTCCAQKGFGLS